MEWPSWGLSDCLLYVIKLISEGLPYFQPEGLRHHRVGREMDPRGGKGGG